MKGVYSLYDHKAKSFTPPMIFDNDEIAVRSITEMLITNKEIPPAKYPGDFSVFRVGDWDFDCAFQPLENGKYSVMNVLQMLSAAAASNSHLAAHFKAIFESQEDNKNGK